MTHEDELLRDGYCDLVRDGISESQAKIAQLIASNKFNAEDINILEEIYKNVSLIEMSFDILDELHRKKS